VFEHLKKFNKIIVTGPGRSGTTISAKIIANELKYKYIDELWFDGSDVKRFLALLEMSRKMVIQMTCMVGRVHTLKYEGLAIVMVRRKIDDILDSMEHTLTFPNAGKEIHLGTFTSCSDEWRINFLRQYSCTSGNIPKIVYDYWDTVQKAEIENWFELEYESLRFHPLWIAKPTRRKCFTHIKQINFDPDYIKNKTGIMVMECES
jgi:hypothetical protein